MNKKKGVLCGFILLVIMIGALLIHFMLSKMVEKEKFTAEVMEEEPTQEGTGSEPEKETDIKNETDKKAASLEWSHTVEVNGTAIILPIRFDSFLEKINGSYQASENETDDPAEETNTEDYSWLEVEAEGHLVDVYVQYREDRNNLDSTKYVMGIQQSYNESSGNVKLSGNIKKGDSYEQVESIYGTPDEVIKGNGETVYKYYNPNSHTLKQNEYIIIGFSDETDRVDYVLNYYDGTEERKE